MMRASVEMRWMQQELESDNTVTLCTSGRWRAMSGSHQQDASQMDLASATWSSELCQPHCIMSVISENRYGVHLQDVTMGHRT